MSATETGGLWPRLMQRWCMMPQGQTPMTVLLVDDDPLVLSVLAEALTECGHRVVPCRDAGECLAALDGAGERLLLVTDMALPGCSGRALAEEVRRRRPGVPVVFATGLPASAVVPLGTDETLMEKPFSLRDFAAVVARLVTVA